MENNQSHFVNYADLIADVTVEWGWSNGNRADLRALGESIRNGLVVAYVGAGPSIAAGLKGWEQLCGELCKWTLEEADWGEGRHSVSRRSA